MARPKIYHVTLSDVELKNLKSIIRTKDISKTLLSRCQVLIDIDEAHGKILTHEQSARSNGICKATVTNIVKLYHTGGIDAVTTIYSFT